MRRALRGESMTWFMPIHNIHVSGVCFAASRLVKNWYVVIQGGVPERVQWGLLHRALQPLSIACLALLDMA